jgi:hypothetical protein
VFLGGFGLQGTIAGANSRDIPDRESLRSSCIEDIFQRTDGRFDIRIGDTRAARVRVEWRVRRLRCRWLMEYVLDLSYDQHGNDPADEKCTDIRSEPNDRRFLDAPLLKEYHQRGNAGNEERHGHQRDDHL